MRNIFPKLLRGSSEGEGSESRGDVKNLLFYLLVAVIVGFILFMLFKIFSKKPNIPKAVPTPTNQQQESPPATPGAKPATSSAREEDSSKKCCTTLSGEQIGPPSKTECTDHEFGTSIRDLSDILKAVNKATGLVLVGDGTSREFNGYVSSGIGKENLSKYSIYLYQTDALNYEYDPPYRYKATPCTNELKEKLEKALNPVSN